MTRSPVRETAQIIPFPVRRQEGKSVSRDAVSEERLAAVACDFGSGWYHDAAVQEEVRKHPQR